MTTQTTENTTHIPQKLQDGNAHFSDKSHDDLRVQNRAWYSCIPCLFRLTGDFNNILKTKTEDDKNWMGEFTERLDHTLEETVYSLGCDSVLQRSLSPTHEFVPEYCVPQKVTVQSADTQAAVIAAGILNAEGVPITKVRELIFSNAEDFNTSDLAREIRTISLHAFAPLIHAIEQAIGEQHSLMFDESNMLVFPRDRKASKTAAMRRLTCFVDVVQSANHENKKGVVLRCHTGKNTSGLPTLQAFHPKVWVYRAFRNLDDYFVQSDSKLQCSLTMSSISTGF